MNKKAQPIDARAILELFGVVIIFILFMTTLINLSCQTEKQQRETCCSERDAWMGAYTSMNESIANCSNLIQEQKDKCDKRIENATQTCEKNNVSYENWIILYKIYLIVYVGITFILWFPLSINLFKIVVKIGLKKEWEEKIYKLEKFWLILKISLWIILTLLGLISLLAMIFSNPLT